MLLDITELLREPGKQMPYEIDEPPFVDEHVECTNPIDGKITFTNTGGTLIIRGSARTRVALACSRCTEYFEQPVSLKIDEQFELNHVSAGPRTLQVVAVVEEDESPIAGKLFDGQVFDLTEMLRQYILLDEPTQPLPPALANGRCSHCKLLPEEVCPLLHESEKNSGEKPINPAFAVLGQLLDKK